VTTMQGPEKNKASDSSTSESVESTSEGEGALLGKLKLMKEWSRGVIFDEEGHVLAATFAPNDAEIKALLTAFKDYDTTVGGGLTIAGDNYDVHRFYETLIYGRRGDNETGEGIALCKVIGNKNKKSYFGLITYGFPTLSARAVPQLKDFMRDNVQASH